MRIRTYAIKRFVYLFKGNLKLIPENLSKAKPIARSGEKPVIEKITSDKDGITKIIKLIRQYQDKDCQSIGILAKTEKECRTIYSALIKLGNKSKIKNRFANINFIDGSADKYNGGISIVPIALSKGLISIRSSCGMRQTGISVTAILI